MESTRYIDELHKKTLSGVEMSLTEHKDYIRGMKRLSRLEEVTREAVFRVEFEPLLEILRRVPELSFDAVNAIIRPFRTRYTSNERDERLRVFFKYLEKPVVCDSPDQLIPEVRSYLTQITLMHVLGFQLQYLAFFPELEQLTLTHYARVDSESMRQLQHVPKLQHLDIADIKTIDCDVYKHLEGLTELRRLFLAGTHVGDDELCRLGALQKLEHLELRNTLVTYAGLRDFFRTVSLPQLTSIDVGVLSQDLRPSDIINCPQLQRIYAFGDEQYTDENFQAFAARGIELVTHRAA